MAEKPPILRGPPRKLSPLHLPYAYELRYNSLSFFLFFPHTSSSFLPVSPFYSVPPKFTAHVALAFQFGPDNFFFFVREAPETIDWEVLGSL